jgi:hypothetical protein
LALPWGSIGVFLYHDALGAEALAVQSTSNLVRAFEESTRRTWVREKILPDKMTAAIVWLIPKAGSSPIQYRFPRELPSAAGRIFWYRRIPLTTIFISASLCRVSGRDTIQFTRKLVGPSGEFASIIVLSLDCEELSRFYQTLDLGGGFVRLMSTDSTILARGPFAKNVLGKPLASSAALHDLTMRDSGFCTHHRPAVASYRHLVDYPLIIMVGLDLQIARCLRGSGNGTAARHAAPLWLHRGARLPLGATHA